ncbi:MAG: class I SAM-dependent methyltransferase [Solirubrobacteraceae bacterium]
MLNVNAPTSRLLVLALLRRLRYGSLTLIESGRDARTFGDQDTSGPHVTLEVLDPSFHRLLLAGSIGLSEAYMARMFECDDLPGLARLAALNMHQLDTVRRVVRPAVALPQRGLRWLERNTPARSRKQIAAHYDLGNDLFGLMLDETMMYSCAIFESGQATLHEAQISKLDRICQKLGLGPGDRVLEIGTGWGGFAIHAARNYGCRVTTTTISAEQHSLAQERVSAAGLGNRIDLLLEDYRNLSGRYDKLVSIEMIEAVGWQYFDTFFEQCGSLLDPGGTMLLQAITIDDRAYEVEKGTRSFANTHVFPGGCLPSMKAISRSVARASDMRAVHLEDITSHYVHTLRAWRENFHARIERVRELGYDSRFERLWELYLAYCEGGFAERRIRTVQLMLGKPEYRGSPSLPAQLAAAAR